MAYNRNQKRGKYLRYCYFENVSPFLSASAPLYEFAVEYSKTEDFISVYSGKHDGYCFVKSDELGLQKQKNNARFFCERCRGADPVVFKGCKYRTLVENENLIEIVLRDEAVKHSVFCDLCNRQVYLNPRKMKLARAKIQDVRLRGRPTKLLVKRQRYYCPDCHKYLGIKFLPDLQAYCGGEMTARLAASVLLSQLSAVKREYIAEAYGLSKSQIDRIKKRMIERAKEARQILADLYVLDHLNSEIICKVFKGNKSRHVYYAYFLRTKAGEILLINIITQAVRDAAADWEQEPASFIKRFSQWETFYFMCFCILAGEKNVHGQQLMERLDALSDWYGLLTNPTEMPASLLNYQDTPEGRAEKRFLRDSLRRKHLTSFEETSDHADPVNGGTIEFYMPKETASSDSIGSFISTVTSAYQSESDISHTELINRLLYFNPAVIIETEIRYLVEGERFATRAGTYYFDLDIWPVPPLGAPISCLEHFIKKGLLREDNTRLMPCILTQNGTEDRPNEQRELPCGLPCDSCPHLVKK
ncbi:MAG: transposase family protein [Oscillospiraceae bacterium]|nr:transposase family protein [Oscillospiraceae bacterium]